MTRNARTVTCHSPLRLFRDGDAPTASTRTCRRDGVVSREHSLPGPLGVTCGLTLATSPLRRETRCGKGAAESWPFR